LLLEPVTSLVSCSNRTDKRTNFIDDTMDTKIISLGLSLTIEKQQSCAKVDD
jgi:hypothetical protein